MRIVFCGTPEFAVPTLRRLLSDARFDVAAVVTQPDRPRGRGQQVSASPVKQAAIDAGVRVYQPEKIRDPLPDEFFRTVAPDAVVIIAYGQIVPARLIAIPRLGWINLHASLLPRYRGAAPIAWTIANGDTITGLTTMQIDAGMDTGRVLLQKQIEIAEDETAPELARRMAEAGAPLVTDSLINLDLGEITPAPQDASHATYAPRLQKEDGRIDWSHPAREIYNRMRGFTPWPGAYTTFRGQRCHVWGRPAELPHHVTAHATSSVASSSLPGTLVTVVDTLYVLCGDGTSLALTWLQIEGRNRLSTREFINGMRLTAGELFGR